MLQLRILVLSIALIVSASLQAVEFGDPSKFAIRFDDATGNLTEFVYKGETVTLPVKEKQGFDISLDGNWQYGKHPVELVAMGKEKGSGNAFNVTQKFGDWTLTFRYTVDVKTATLGRSVKLVYTGKEPVKIKGFWFSYPVFPFEKNARFIVPGLYPPKVFTPDNFAEGSKQGIWRNAAPFAMQLGASKSVIMMQDNLVDHADRGSADASHRDGGIRLAQSFATLGHIEPGVEQTIGTGYLRFVDGDVETALTGIHDLMRDLGHVVPEDRPKWFEEAITYSFHPGGTIGSNCKDLGGFVPAAKHLDRIKQLGCNAVWFMPLEDKSIYWPRDYYKFQDGLGTTPEKAGEEYKTLVDRAHELGMKVLQDSVPHGGSNTYQRMIDHPEWLAQEEDGSTLHYWCADFNWPTWIDYMAGVSTHYVKTYGIDGFRVDACGGSKIPNWNPAIPYARASHSQSQGGLNMLRAIRKAVKDQKPDGAILAEVQGSVFGAVSDAVYDFELAYNVLHDARKQTPEEFVKRLRRWLHEQQYSEIPDLLRLRHVESHDSLRAQLWYGTEPHRALMALTTFIHGIPLVYHEQEIGHLFEFRKLFAIRQELPELNGGDADYLCVDAATGVFAVLRTKGDDASVVLINFNPSHIEGTAEFSVPLDKLPASLRNAEIRTVPIMIPYIMDDEHYKTEIRNGRLCGKTMLPLGSFQTAVFALRPKDRDIDRQAMKERMLTEADGFNGPTDVADTEGTVKLELEDNGAAYIDRNDGLPVRVDQRGKPVFGKADLFLSPEFLKQPGKTSVKQTEKGIEVKKEFGRSTLEILYSKTEKPKNLDPGFPYLNLLVEARWTGSDIPNNSAVSLPLVGARTWAIAGLGDRYEPRHLHTDGVYGSIYWRPQGTNVVYDSFLNPLQINKAFWFNTKNGMFGMNFDKQIPTRLRLLDRIGDRKELSVLVSLTDEETDALPGEPGFQASVGVASDSRYISACLIPMTGGWIYENDYYRLRLTRSGTVMSLEDKKGTKIIHQGDLYTDYGYGAEKMRYAAGNDVEAGCRIVKDGDVLRLRFEGQLRGFGRFDLMRPPVEYFTEYALSEKSPAFGFSCGVRTNRSATGDRAFLALMLPMPTVERFEYFKDGKPIAEGTNVDAKGRSFQCRDALPDRVLLKDAKKNQLELTGLEGDASNLFLDQKNFFVTFDDGENLGTPGRWRSFTTTVSTLVDHDSPSPKVTPTSCDLRSQTNLGFLVDGGFEAVASNDLVSLRTGVVLKGPRGHATGWQTPPQGAVVTDVFRSGKSSARIVGETAQYRHFEQDVAVKNLKPGQKLRLTAWAKGDDLKRGPKSWQVGSVRLVALVDGKNQYASAPALLGTFDWKEVFVEFIVPEKLQRLSVQVGVNGAAGTVWIDDARLETLP